MASLKREKLRLAIIGNSVYELIKSGGECWIEVSKGAPDEDGVYQVHVDHIPCGNLREGMKEYDRVTRKAADA